MEYLYEMHVHTVEVSTCAAANVKELLESYEGKGYTGFISTNHMNSSTFDRVGLKDAPWDEKVDHFLTGFYALKEAAGDKYKVILAMEINFYNNPNDYLVYGITEEFLRAHGDLMAMKPKQFAKLAHENGLLFIQAHPFRRGMKIEDWKILDGYEIFNGNPRHHSGNETAKEWARIHNKDIVTSGSDFHEVEDAAIGGIYFKRIIENNDELLEELRKGDYRLKITDIPYTRPE